MSLIEKLRKHASITDKTGSPYCNLLHEAADELERLSHSSMHASKAIDAFLRKDQELSDAFRCFNAAINFTLEKAGPEGLLFLGLWREGNWEGIAKEFPEFDIQKTGTNGV